MASKPRAYALQARDDFAAFVALGATIVPGVGEHHRVLLLQMSLEKMAKAFLYDAEPDATYSHNAVVHAINRLRNHAVAAATQLSPISKLNWRIQSARPIVLQVAAASPSVGQDGAAMTREQSELHENVEYPWRAGADDAASWTSPSNHDFGIVRVLRRDARAASAVELLDRLIRAADLLIA